MWVRLSFSLSFFLPFSLFLSHSLPHSLSVVLFLRLSTMWLKKKEEKKQIVRELTRNKFYHADYFPLSPLLFLSQYHLSSLSPSFSLVYVCDSTCLFLGQIQTLAIIRGEPKARSAAAGGWARPWGAIIWSADASSASASVRESPSAQRRRPDASRHPVVRLLSCLQSNAAID